MRALTRNAVLLGAASLLVAGCADARLDKLNLGMNQDAVAGVMGTPHRELSFLAAGRTWRLQMFARGEAQPADSIAWRKLTPVAMIDNKVVGWGWKYWDKQAAARHLPTGPTE